MTFNLLNRFSLGGGMGLASGVNRRKTLMLNSSAAITAWVNAYNGTLARASTMMVPDKDGVFRETPINEPAIWKGEWDAVNSKWLPAPGAGMAFWPSVTNAFLSSKYRDFGGWDAVDCVAIKDQTGIDGALNTAWTLEDDDESSSERVYESIAITSGTDWHSTIMFIEKSDDMSTFPLIYFKLDGATAVAEAILLNKKTGAVHELYNDGECVVLDCGTWWAVCLAAQDNDSGNSSARFYIYPAYSSNGTSVDHSATGSVVVDWAGYFPGQRRPCPFPIPGGDTLADQTFSFDNNKLISNLKGAVYAEAQVLPDLHEPFNNAGIITCDSTLIYLNDANGGEFATYENAQMQTAIAADGLNKVVCKWADSQKALGLNGEMNANGAYTRWYTNNKEVIIGFDQGSFPGIISKVIFDYLTPRTTEYWEAKTE